MSSYDDLYYRYMDEANAYARAYGLEYDTRHNGAWDAFRHAYTSAEMTREFGEAAAHAAGLNELRGDNEHQQPSYERNMDEWNNAAGRNEGKSSTSSAESAQRVFDAMKRGDLITDPISDARHYDDTWRRIKDRMNDLWERAKSWRPVDPLALDLDNDGLETVGITATNQVLFDHNGDAIKTGTGWVKGDDALLVLDKNANGTIDNGRGDAYKLHKVRARLRHYNTDDVAVECDLIAAKTHEMALICKL